MTQAIEAEEAARKASVEVEALKKNQAEESMKLISSLAKIENLKEVHLSQSEVASLTKWVETSDNHQRITAEALLELANKENASMKEQLGVCTPKFLAW